MTVLPQLRPSAVGDGVYQLSSLGAKVTAFEHEGDVMLVDTGARGSYPLVARSRPKDEGRKSPILRNRLYGKVPSYSSRDNKAAFPPAAAVSTESVRSTAKRCRYRGPPALGPVPERPSPPKGCTPTTAPIMERLT